MNKSINRLIAEARGWTEFNDDGWDMYKRDYGETGRNPITGDEQFLPDCEHCLDDAWPLLAEMRNTEIGIYSDGDVTIQYWTHQRRQFVMLTQATPADIAYAVCEAYLESKGIDYEKS